MYKPSFITAAAIVAVAGAQTASAQLTLGLDVNDFEYSFTDSSGAETFGGERHTGAMRWSMASDAPEESRVVDARMGEDGPFGLLHDVTLGSGLRSFDAIIDLDSGRIRGGNITIALDNGDTYTADFAGGKLISLGSSGYVLDGVTLGGAFSDDQFGDIDVSEFNDLDSLPGWSLAFRFNPTAAEASGTADAEVFVMVPLPPAALAGLGMLAGVMGVSIARRRRMA